MTFEEYMKEVDTHIRKVIGLDHQCIADWRYRDAYEDEVPAIETAANALEFDGTVPADYIYEVLDL